MSAHAELVWETVSARLEFFGWCFLHGAFWFAPFRDSPFAACCSAIFFTVSIPALAGRFISGDAEQGSRQRNGYPVTPRLSLSCPLHAGNKTQSVQKTAPRR
jgi:hypothetical protein